ncbi:MAG: hypothetical protein CMP59_06540 [Flavobacteriales bacterium]|nr:hypothetical protein [Flavobacteriales bacterium]|tara:strand:- start:4 stop:1800 length:1797 start_codon:yes stop_codon:yes gene_type:complete
MNSEFVDQILNKYLTNLQLYISDNPSQMKYTFSYSNPNSHYINIQFELELNGETSVDLQLPAWRPGRYELGNFAKNIQKWEAFDENGKKLSAQKMTKDLWRVQTKSAKKLMVQYNYFAFELNAGSTFLSEEQLYVNPVNCCLYDTNRAEEPCELILDVPEDYKVATSLKKVKKHEFKAKDFDELADSPFIASASLKHFKYTIDNTNFHLWFQGSLKGDFDKLINDFTAFSKEQGKLFKGFPFKNYHFLFHILPVKAYHGVEHADSTVIALGPTYEVMDPKKLYDELLGVSSHELFHAWNVKRIRPAEMWPYDFTQENYSRLGYLAEGATTWYGDLMLYRSGVFTDESFLKTFSQLMNKHFNNPGVLNLSVADSSFDTWLDGYGMGVPNRKSSIYTEGALITFLLDIEIRKSTTDKHSFDEVLRTFYEDFYLKGKGITETDYQNVVEQIAGKKLGTFFKKYVNGVEDYFPELKKALDYLGMEVQIDLRENYHESYLGFVCDENDKVLMIYPNSAADDAGLSVEDQIRTINGMEAKGKISEWTKYFGDEQIELGLISKYGEDCAVQMKATDEIFYANYKVRRKEKPSKEQEERFKKWMKT